MDAWTSAIHRRRYLVVLAWVALVAVAFAAQYGGFGPKLSDLLSNRFDLPGTESARALAILQKNFHERDDSSFTVVFQPTGSAPVNRGRGIAVARGPGPHARQGGDRSPARHPRRSAATPPSGPRSRPTRPRSLCPTIRAARPDIPGTRTYLTGTVAVNKDLQPVFDHDLQRGEFLIALPVGDARPAVHLRHGGRHRRAPDHGAGHRADHARNRCGRSPTSSAWRSTSSSSSR